MFDNFWKVLSTIVDNQNGYIGKEKKAAWANEQAIADKQAAVLREQIASQERIMREQTEATMRASRDSAVAGVIGAALGAHTTTEQIKQLLPVESGSATLQSYDLAEKWNTTLQMKTQGYSNTAIDYALSGNNYRALYKDSKMNSAMFIENQKKDLISSLQTFGIQSAGNPSGIAMSADEFIRMHSVKDAKSMLEVDPALAKQREEEFAKWERDMRMQGKGLLVDMYKNPQLAGSNILAMKGPDPLIPKEMQPLLSAVAGGGQQGNVNWADVMKQMNSGVESENTKQIKWAMDNGIIDKYGQINGGALLQNVPPDLQKPLAYDPHRVLSPEETATLMNDYNKLSQIVVDPKLIREQQLGMGVVARTKLNADGTVSGKFMSGYMTDSTGAQIQVTVQGDNMNDWMRKQTDAMSGLGPLFPQFFAMKGASDGDRTKELTNQLATANQGNKNNYMSTDAVGAQQQKQAAEGQPAPQVTVPGTTPKKAPTNNGAVGQVVTPQTQASTPPSGYSGAPLAAGG